MAAVIPGQVRLVWTDPLRQTSVPLWESRTEPMTDAIPLADKTKRPILEKYSTVFKDNDFLCVEINSDAAALTAVANCLIEVPVTMYNYRTGQVFPSSIGKAGQYAFTVVDATTVAGTYYRWGRFQLPLGLNMKLGQANAFNSKVFIALST